MTTDQFARATDNVHKAGDAVQSAADHGHKALNEAIAAAARTLNSATGIAETLLNDGLKRLRQQSDVYARRAEHDFGDAQKFVAKSVKERPITVALASLGVGILLAVLFASPNRPK